jgi:UDP-N-acetylglucosamine transferase subunit ALG13
MIFVTVGYQMPFDRMVRTVDEWAGQTGRSDVFAQIGPTQYRPSHMQWTQFIDPPEFKARVKTADLIVAHAGMGSIITALELGKPILVMPRRGDLKETRNDHQVATAKRFLDQGRIAVAFDENELKERLELMHGLRGKDPISSHAAPQLIETLRAFVCGEDVISRIARPGAGDTQRQA